MQYKQNAYEVFLQIAVKKTARCYRYISDIDKCRTDGRKYAKNTTK